MLNRRPNGERYIFSTRIVVLKFKFTISPSMQCESKPIASVKTH